LGGGRWDISVYKKVPREEEIKKGLPRDPPQKERKEGSRGSRGTDQQSTARGGKIKEKRTPVGGIYEPWGNVPSEEVGGERGMER